jgi:hypothetical protein
VTTVLRGPERVYRVHLTRRVANFGVVVTREAHGSRVEPRVVSGLDENRLTGYAGLPVDHNPYLETFQDPVLAAAALSPLPGDYAVVFDSAGAQGAGGFAFRYWVNDVTPPILTLATRTIMRSRPLRIAANDVGSGIYAESIFASIDGAQRGAAYQHGVITLLTHGLARGVHHLRLRVSDYQESKNTENVQRILPNTRWLTATFRVR